jgi:FAD/FMN-containing dehydrogenase
MEEYELTRRIHNGLIDRRPALIARCRGTADIVDAVNFGREQGLEVAVRGAGHNVAGRAVVDAGLMIDLSPMRGIHVDPRERVARAQGGVTWGEFNRETQLHGLATTGGVVSTTGISGLTLGGGLGWLMSKYGLTADNLRSVEIVTADGRTRRASAEEEPDLFWAVRGGGGNFGVVAWFEYQLHPVGPVVTGGLVAHPFDRAWDVLRYYRDFTASLPDELTAYAGLVHAPDGSGAKLAAMVVCHCGSLEDGAAATKPLKGFASPAVDAIGPISYSQLNGMDDTAFPKGALNYWKSNFLSALSDDAIRASIDSFAACPSIMSRILFEHMHGALTRVEVGATAFPHRAEGYNIFLLTQWAEARDNDRCINWTRDSYAKLQPFLGPGQYVNYQDLDEAGDPAAAAYGPNYPRLQRIKSRYDPGNLFHFNQNIRPG